MAKFNPKNLTIAVLFGILLIGVMGVVNAQEALPAGGDSFDTAVEIKPGSYKGEALKSHEAEYFYITDIKPGQEIKINGTFTPETKLSAIATIDLYDENRTDLRVGCDESGEGTMDISCEISWMTNSDRETYKYYIRTGSDVWNITSYLLDISLVDRYDAESQTDAGDTIKKAIDVKSGEYKSYLSGEQGTDARDFYKVAVKKGQTLVAKVTPPSEASIRITVYDSNKTVLKDEYAPNLGAIVTNSVPITKSGDVFVGVICDKYCSKELVAYTLNIATEGVVAEEEEYDEEGLPYYGVDGAVPGNGVEKGGSNWALILGIIALIVIVGIAAYFLLKKKGKKENTDNSLKI